MCYKPTTRSSFNILLFAVLPLALLSLSLPKVVAAQGVADSMPIETFGLDKEAATRGLIRAIAESDRGFVYVGNAVRKQWTRGEFLLTVGRGAAGTFQFAGYTITATTGFIEVTAPNGHKHRTALGSYTSGYHLIAPFSDALETRDNTDPLPSGVTARYTLNGDVNTLLRAGADPNALLDAQSSHLEAMLRASHSNPALIANVLQRHGQAMLAGEFRQNTVLHDAARDALHGRINTIVDLLHFGANPNRRGWRNNTPLHVAAACGYAQAVGLLLLAGADKDAKNSDGETPLDLARRAAVLGNSPLSLMPVKQPPQGSMRTLRGLDYVNVIRLLEAAQKAKGFG